MTSPRAQPLHPTRFPDIDGSRPWFSGLQPYAARLVLGESVADSLEMLKQALDRSAVQVFGACGTCSDLDRVNPAPPTFVPQHELPGGTAYESYIARTGRVPTRDNLHDLLNGLVWLWQPALKWRLNRLQATLIERDGIGPHRGRARDALTLFDENGAVWRDPDPVLLDALRRRDWHGLGVTHRARWTGQQLDICGHALLEQLVQAPRKGLVAHVCVGQAPWTMDEAGWAGKPFLPLPVLGIPGWWPGQEDPAFYADSQVFRGPRS